MLSAYFGKRILETGRYVTAILVESPGLFTMVQDLGREGYGPMGVSASGAADPISLRIGNLLVGNSEGAAALEMTLIGGAFTFEKAAIISITGADFRPLLDDKPLPMWTAVALGSGQRVTFGPSRSGARAYARKGLAAHFRAATSIQAHAFPGPISH